MLYGIFQIVSDGYTYSTETLIGVFDSYENAFNTYWENCGKYIKRFGELRKKFEEGRLTNKEYKEFSLLTSKSFLNSEFSIKEIKLNKLEGIK